MYPIKYNLLYSILFHGTWIYSYTDISFLAYSCATPNDDNSKRSEIVCSVDKEAKAFLKLTQRGKFSKYRPWLAHIPVQWLLKRFPSFLFCWYPSPMFQQAQRVYECPTTRPGKIEIHIIAAVCLSLTQIRVVQMVFVQEKVMLSAHLSCPLLLWNIREHKDLIPDLQP